MAAELLKADNLTVGYGRRAVLHEISFTIERGDFLGVMGPNGSGKTTLLKTFLGLLKPLSGTIESFGAGKDVSCSGMCRSAKVWIIIFRSRPSKWR